jgi:hypothetical protein
MKIQASLNVKTTSELSFSRELTDDDVQSKLGWMVDNITALRDQTIDSIQLLQKRKQSDVIQEEEEANEEDMDTNEDGIVDDDGDDGEEPQKKKHKKK